MCYTPFAITPIRLLSTLKPLTLEIETKCLGVLAQCTPAAPLGYTLGFNHVKLCRGPLRHITSWFGGRQIVFFPFHV
jgi:hypothetical protein